MLPEDWESELKMKQIFKAVCYLLKENHTEEQQRIFFFKAFSWVYIDAKLKVVSCTSG